MTAEILPLDTPISSSANLLARYAKFNSGENNGGDNTTTNPDDGGDVDIVVDPDDE